MTPTELWQQILAAPSDAALKSAFVEALAAADDWRAEIFSAAAEYQRLRSASYIDAAAALKPRVDLLIDRWRAEFAPRADAWRAEIVFVMGWPIELTIAAADLVQNAADIVTTLPIRHLNLREVSAVPGVFDLPELAQIASIDGSRQPWSDEAIHALAGSAYVRALRWLDLSHADVSESQVEVLAASPALQNVEMLDLSNNPTRDPVDASAGYGTDWESNKIIPDSIFMPQFGTQLEAKYGKITWLHGLSNFMEAYPPSRYTF